MFVAYGLKNDSTEFDENLKNCFKRYQESLESSLNRVRKYTKRYNQSTADRFPISFKLIHIMTYVKARFARELRYTKIEIHLN